MEDKPDSILPVVEALKTAALVRQRDLGVRRRQIETRLDQISAFRSWPSKPEDIHALQQCGADHAWQAWQSAKRATLLQDLALVRAQELDNLPRSRLAVAREDALQQIVRMEAKWARVKRAQKQIEDLQALSVLIANQPDDTPI